MLPSERARGTVGILRETFAGALAYFLVPAIVFLLVEPYKKNRFVRFHSFQSVGAWLAAVVAAAVLRVLGVVLVVIPRLGPLLVWLVSMLVILALIMTWIVLVVKALLGEMFELPVVGEFAEKQANQI